MVLAAASPDGATEATKQLDRLATLWQGDVSFRLGVAELRTYRTSTRPAGIDQLRDLARIPSIGARAHAAWREALLWQGADPQTLDQVNVYLRENPPDPAILEKQSWVQGTLDRMHAYDAKEAGRSAEAEQAFRAAIQHDPGDAKSMIMLANILSKRGPSAEADHLIVSAMALHPERRDEFTKDIGFDPAPLLASDLRSQTLLDATVLTAVGRYDAAERLLSQPENAGDSLAAIRLGRLQLWGGRLADANDSFGRARSLDPGSGDALCGLADVARLEHRYDESEALYLAAGDLFTAADQKAGLGRSAAGLAALKREKARQHDIQVAQRESLKQIAEKPLDQTSD